MTINAITLVDLDDTLFQTARKCPPHIPANQLTPMAFGEDGRPISYATPAQMNFIRWLEETTFVVAVTARSTAALLRADLNFRMAVTSHGGSILRTGRDHKGGPPPILCEAWHFKMQKALLPHYPLLMQMEANILTYADSRGHRVRTRIVDEGGLPLYLVIKHQDADGNDDELHDATRPARLSLPIGWTAHVNGNNVALMPPGLGKAHAAAVLLDELRATHPHLPVIGIGDSHTDADFMALCNFAMTPTGSQLAGQIFKRDRR